MPFELESVVVALEPQHPDRRFGTPASGLDADLANALFHVRRPDVQSRFAVHFIGREELDPDPAAAPATVLLVRPGPPDAVVGAEEFLAGRLCQRQGALSGPANRHSAGAEVRGAFMGLGNPMGQLGTVLVFEDERLLALDDQNDGPGRLPALEQIRLRTIVTPRHQPRRPRRLRGGQGAGPARPEDRLTGIDLTGEHEEQSAGDSLDAPGAHRPILVSDEQRHVRHVSRPVFEAIVAALGFHDQERVHRSQSQAPLPRHGLPPAYRPRFTLAGGGERGLQVYGIGPQALVGLGCQGRRDPGMSARGEVERLHGRSPASYLRMVLIFRRRLCLAERDSNVPASSHTGIVPDEVTGPTRSGSSAIRPSSNLSLIRSSSRSAPPPCSPPPPRFRGQGASWAPPGA